jgi:hypothetical protein
MMDDSTQAQHWGLLPSVGPFRVFLDTRQEAFGILHEPATTRAPNCSEQLCHIRPKNVSIFSPYQETVSLPHHNHPGEKHVRQAANIYSDRDFLDRPSIRFVYLDRVAIDIAPDIHTVTPRGRAIEKRLDARRQLGGPRPTVPPRDLIELFGTNDQRNVVQVHTNCGLGQKIATELPNGHERSPSPCGRAARRLTSGAFDSSAKDLTRLPSSGGRIVLRTDQKVLQRRRRSRRISSRASTASRRSREPIETNGLSRRHLRAFPHPFVAAFNITPVERNRGAGTVAADGASYREIFDASSWDRSLVLNTPAQSGQPGTPSTTPWQRCGATRSTSSWLTRGRRWRRWGSIGEQVRNLSALVDALEAAARTSKKPRQRASDRSSLIGVF